MKILCLILLGFSLGAYAQEQKTLPQLRADLKKIDQSIEVTRSKMRQVKDVTFLPDLYFVLAELYVEKSRYQATIIRLKNPKTPANELDFSDSRRSKKQAIEVYQRILETFPKSDVLDRALFYMAHEYREMGNVEEMVKTYIKLTTEYPKSSFWEESQLVLGDYFLEQKKDPKLALDVYQKILSRPENPFMPLARYKTGWCFINLERFHDALLAFEGVLIIDKSIPTDKLPDLYKKSDVKRDALLALVWPYSEEKKHEPGRSNALEYFERLAPNRPALAKVLDKLIKRLMLKNKVDETIPLFLRLFDIINDLALRIDLTDRFYEALRKAKKAWPLDTMPDEITLTTIRSRGSTDITQADRMKLEKNFEIYMRDITTRLQQKAKRTNKEEDYLNAINGYKDYLTLFPKQRFSNAIELNLAESYYLLKKYTLAGLHYESLSNKSKLKTKKEFLDSAIQSYAFALKDPLKLSKLELTEARTGFRTTGTGFLKSFPTDNASAMIMFNIGRTYYDERLFDKAVKSFTNFINSFPNHKESTTAGNLILDSYNQREDFEGMIKAGRGLINNPRITNRQFKADVAEIIKQAEYRKIENVAGDPKSRDYAKKLLGFAEKYRGSTLGDQALYEAFISLKAKKDFQAYDIGEQLLVKHGDSRYAQQVVGDMGQMALNTADYRRAARYFEVFARKYPKDKSSPGLLKNAASMRELMGDYKESAEDYRDLSEYTLVAKQYITAQSWSEAAQTLASRSLNNLQHNYWLGLSFYRQGQLAQSKAYLSKAASSPASTYEEKKMAAHSLYLLATEALKDYQAIRLGSGQDEAKLVQVKNAKLTQLVNQFNQVIKFGNGRWTIAALYQIGRAHLEFAEFIKGAATPAGLSAAQKAQYQQLIGQQSNTYIQKAKNFFNSCVQNAEKSEVFTGFVKGCQSQGSENVDETIEEKILSKASDSSPPEAGAIRRKLFDTPRDLKLLLELAQAYIRARDYSMARVILSRMLDIQPNSALAEAQLGQTFLFMNDLEAAQGTFKQALSHNSREPLALWGLSGMYNQFGFRAKAQGYLQRAKKAGRPSGILHPWVSGLSP